MVEIYCLRQLFCSSFSKLLCILFVLNYLTIAFFTGGIGIFKFSEFCILLLLICHCAVLLSRNLVFIFSFSNFEVIPRRTLPKSLAYQCNFSDFGFGQRGKTILIVPIDHCYLRRNHNL